MIARRRLLAMSAVAALPGEAWLLGRLGDPKPLALRLVGLLERRAEAMALGKAYLKLYPEEAGAEPLMARLLPDLPRRPEALRRLTKAGLREAARWQRQHDFACGDTVIIDGWIVARTEARLCALTVLV